MRWLLILALIGSALRVPSTAFAHDDPIVTVRVLCNGFNVVDIDAVLGELSDTATLSVDRSVQGRSQIEPWVREQMDHDLRIEIVDIGIPQRLPDGYTLAWTGRFSRDDWRAAGVATREVNNAVTIHNGRITSWNAAMAPLASGTSTPPQPAPPPAASLPSSSSPVPEVLGIPITLLVAVLLLGCAGAWLAHRRVR